jgi:NitT/TauT family transport system substrate-binding protein
MLKPARWFNALPVLCAAALAACGGSSAAPAPSAPPASAAAPASKPAAPASAAAASASAKPAPSAKPASSASAGASAKPAAGNLTKITVANSSLSATNLPSWVGKQAGIYEQNGLDINFTVIPGGSTTTSSLLGGDVQIVMGGGSEALAAAAGGADLVIVGITVPKWTIVIEVPDSVKTPADLKGKTLGVPAARGTVDIATRIGLQSLGLDPDKDLKITALGSVQAVTAAVLSGAIDGAGMNIPDNLAAEAKGHHPLLNMGKADIPAASNSIYSTRTYIAQHKDVMQHYVDGVVQSIARVRKDREISEAATKTNLKIDDPRSLDAVYDFFKDGVFPPLPYPKVENFRDIVPIVGAQNPAVLTFDVNKILDPSFVQSAADRGLDKS